MKRTTRNRLFGAVIIAALAVLPGMAQQTTGEPGSPSATATISGRELPAPPAPRIPIPPRAAAMAKANPTTRMDHRPPTPTRLTRSAAQTSCSSWIAP